MPGETAQIDNTIRIVTPENIAFHYRLAGPFRRLPAFLIDLVIRAFLFWAILAAAFSASPLLGGLLAPVLLLSYFVLDWFYGGLFETYMNGQTPGKWLVGIRVLTTAGEPIDGLQAVMRNILRLVDMSPLLSLEVFGLPPLYLLPTFAAGLAAASLNPRFQRLGDLACGTMVVIEERRRLTGTARLEDPQAARLAAHIPADFRVSPSMARALAAYADRRRYFSPPRRQEIARHLAEPLLRLLRLPPDTSYDLLLCALYHRAFIADRDEEQQRAGDGASPFLTP
jgi:uncharacterized RDD family membrane protein YckC